MDSVKKSQIRSFCFTYIPRFIVWETSCSLYLCVMGAKYRLRYSDVLSFSRKMTSAQIRLTSCIIEIGVYSDFLRIEPNPQFIRSSDNTYVQHVPVK